MRFTRGETLVIFLGILVAVVGMVVVASLRLAALRWGITVPAFELSTTQEYQARRTREPDGR